MKLLKLLCITVLAVVLSACGTFKQVEKQEVTKTVLVEPPYDLLKDCDVVPPFNRREYIEASLDKKEEMFTKLVIDQYGSIKQCNITKAELRKWFEDQRTIFNK
jgi:hypothetical protein